MTFAVECAIRVAIVAGAALAIARAARGRSAATRHWILASAVLLSAAMPVMTLLMPVWHVVPPAPSPFNSSTSVENLSRLQTTDGTANNHQIPAITAARLEQLAWLAGAGAGFVCLLAGLLRLRRIASFAEPVLNGPWRGLTDSISRECGVLRRIRLLRSPNASILVTWGLIRPVVILPAGSEDWPDDRIRSVLYHELSHIRRGDWLIQLLAETLRAVYWFNPLLWLLCTRLRLESEYACDDTVIEGGLAGTKYAAHLLEIVQALQQNGRAWSSALAMARPSTIERRFAAVLNPRLNRRPITRSGMLVVGAAALCLTLPLAALTSMAPPAVPEAPVAPAPVAASPQTVTGRLNGTVSDDAGVKVTGATVIVSTLDGRTQATATTNAQGSFSFSGLSAGSYVLQVFATGFGPSRLTNFEVTAGRETRQDLKLDIGFVKTAQPSSPSTSSAKTYTGEKISLDMKDADPHDFFRLISQLSGLNIVLDPEVSGRLTLRLTSVPWDQALDIVLTNYRLTSQLDGNVLRIRKPGAAASEAFVLRVELYRNGVLIAAPAIVVDDKVTTSMTQTPDSGDPMALSFTPNRLPDGTIAVTANLMMGGKTTRYSSVFADGEMKTVISSVGPSDWIEVKLSVTPQVRSK